MRFGRIALTWVCGLAVSSCSQHADPKSTPRPVVARQSVGTVATLAKDQQCVYYRDIDTGAVMRVSIDGTVRELVIKCGDGGYPYNLQPTRPSAKTQGRIHLAGVPGGSGFTVLDVAGARPTKPGFDVRSGPGAVSYANTDRRSSWNVDFTIGGVEIEPHHVHEYWDSIVFTRGARSVSYDFENVSEQNSGMLGLVDDEHVVLFDKPNILVWNLTSNRWTCIANAGSAVLWPRNLHEKPRYAPIAKWGDRTAVYEWKLHSPDDIHVKPEYVKRKLPPFAQLPSGPRLGPRFVPPESVSGTQRR